MSGVGVADVKARLSAFLRRVKAGQEILITEHGVPVARLAPLRRGGGAERREGLAREGLLRLGRGKVRSLLRRPPRGASVSGVVEALLAERDDGR